MIQPAKAASILNLLLIPGTESILKQWAMPIDIIFVYKGPEPGVSDKLRSFG